MKNKLIILLLIIIFGATLRLYNITANSLYGDELTLVYDAYSILMTGGYDQNGVFLPLTSKMAEGRPMAYVYFSIPFVAIFGPTELGARMLSLLSGVGLIILMFFLGRRLVDEKVGLAAAALMAISPWSIQLSHGGFETHFALFLTVAAVASFLAAKSKPYLLVVSAICFILAIHSYSIYKLAVPLILLTLIWYTKDLRIWLEKKYIVWTGVFVGIIVVGLILLASQMITASSETRFLNLNILGRADIREQITQKINFERSINSGPAFLSPLFLNKNFEYFLLIGDKYLKNFSLDFLFFHGDGNPRHNGATMGELYPMELIFVLLGLLCLLTKKKETLRLVLSWLIMAPVAATLVGEAHALRDTPMLPPLILLSAAGVVYLWQTTSSNYLKWAVAAIFVLQFFVFASRFYFLSPREFSRFWSYPAKLASLNVLQNKDQFKYVILSDSLDNIEFAYPVYALVDPNLVIAQNSQRDTLAGYQFKKLDNVYIGHIPGSNIEQFISNLDGSVLYVGPVEEKPVLSSPEVLSNLDGLPAVVLKKKLL